VCEQSLGIGVDRDACVAEQPQQFLSRYATDTDDESLMADAHARNLVRQLRAPP